MPPSLQRSHSQSPRGYWIPCEIKSHGLWAPLISYHNRSLALVMSWAILIPAVAVWVMGLRRTSGSPRRALLVFSWKHGNAVLAPPKAILRPVGTAHGLFGPQKSSRRFRLGCIWLKRIWNIWNQFGAWWHPALLLVTELTCRSRSI